MWIDMIPMVIVLDLPEAEEEISSSIKVHSLEAVATILPHTSTKGELDR